MNRATQSSVALTHELGHHFRSAGQKVVAANTQQRLIKSRAEREADDWALNTLMEDKAFIEKLSTGLDRLGLADEFGVTEEYVQKKFEQLERKGTMVKIIRDDGMWIGYKV